MKDFFLKVDLLNQILEKPNIISIDTYITVFLEILVHIIN
jgi:hypothetical protein